MEGVLMLRQEKNARTPFCRLPVELLHHILSEVPSPLDHPQQELFSLDTFWCNSATDVITLLPITHTSRYLREVALSYNWLWKTIVADSRFLPTVSVARSGHVPLVAVIKPSRSFAKAVDSLYASLAHRVQELHVMDLYHNDIDGINHLQAFLELDHPWLTSYSLNSEQILDVEWPTNTLPLSQGSAMSLRDLAIKGVPLLPAVHLPSLTHLALCDIMKEGLTDAVIEVLQHCPNLQALVLDNMFDDPDPLSYHPRSLNLPSLRRLTFVNPGGLLLPQILSAIPHRPGCSLQVLGCGVGHEPLLKEIRSRFSEHLLDGATLLSFGDYSATPLNMARMSLTAIGPNSVGHIVMEPYISRSNRGQKLIDTHMKRQLCDKQSLLNIRDVWVWKETFRPLSDPFSSIYHAILTLPSLQTLTIVLNRDGPYAKFVPDLSVCPRAQDPAFCAHHLRTVIIICHQSEFSSDLEPLYFTKMLDQLQSGEYSYFEHLVVKTVSQVVPLDAHLQELCAHFATVRVETIADPPGLPLPEHCVETRAKRNRKAGHGGLW
ncbi:hypothetical protein C8Q74DRAFT_151183 [Fomes fomentarius]|nr:hypothetical protein C8Q74DRAFT_151183 [Fomes fomentarius]